MRTAGHRWVAQTIVVFLAAMALLSTSACRKTPNADGDSSLPPGIFREPGVFVDIAPQWSHDGSKIAFLRRTTDRKLQLCMATADLGRITPLNQPALINPDQPYQSNRTTYDDPDCLSWSQDDSRIAFGMIEWFTYNDGSKQPGTGLCTCDINTRKIRPVAVHPPSFNGLLCYYRAPHWSPDGKKLAFIGEGVRGESAVFVRNIVSQSPYIELPRYDQYLDAGWPSWSPDGTRIAIRQGILRTPSANHIETLRYFMPGGLESRSIYSTVSANSEFPSELSPRLSAPSWSNDGKRITFSIGANPTDPGSYDVWVASLDSHEKPKRISPADGRGYLDPVWIDSNRIGAFRPTGNAYEIVVLPARGGIPRVIGKLPTGDADWSPDRKHIVCSLPCGPKPSSESTLLIVNTGF